MTHKNGILDGSSNHAALFSMDEINDHSFWCPSRKNWVQPQSDWNFPICYGHGNLNEQHFKSDTLSNWYNTENKKQRYEKEND